MGTWGCGLFQNDNALDWLGDFADSATVEMLLTTMSDTSDFNCENVLAAAAVVTALRGNPTADTSVSEQIRTILAENALEMSGELRSAACSAVKRIGSSSDLRARWEMREQMIFVSGAVRSTIFSYV